MSLACRNSQGLRKENTTYDRSNILIGDGEANDSIRND